MHPVLLGNIVLIVVGCLLIISGPIITYKTIQGMKLVKGDELQGGRRWMNVASNGLNFVIAVIFFLAGILFILNNLKGNPLL